MDADYLKENVGSILALGLTDVVLVNPEDPVSYLAQWLLNHVDQLDADEAAKESLATQLEQDEQAAALEVTAQAAKQEASVAQAAQKAANDRVVLQALEDATSTEGLLQTLCTSIVDTHKVPAAYIYSLVDKETLRVVASNQDDLLGRELVRAGDEEEPEGKGVTFTLFDEIEEEEGEEEERDEEEDDEEGEKKAKTKKEERFMYIPDVLSDPKSANVNFYNLPQSGSLFLVRVRYESCLNVDTITQGIREEENVGADSGRKKNSDETESDTEETEEETTETEDAKSSEEVTEGEEGDAAASKEANKAAQAEALEERLLSLVSLKQEDLVIAVDTLGQYKRLTNAQQDLFKQYAASVGKTIERIDKSLFRAERKRRVALTAFNQKQIDSEADEADKKADYEAVQTKLTDEEKPSTADDINFQLRKDALLSSVNRKFILNELGNFEVFWGPIGVVQALLLLLGYDNADLTEYGAGNFASWPKIRKLFNEEFISKIENLDPRSEEFNLPNNKVLRKLIKGQSVNDLKDQNYVLSDILAFVIDTIALKNAADDERKKIKAEAEAAQKAAEASESKDSEVTEESEKTDATESEYTETDATESEYTATETETETEYTETETETE